MPNRGELAGLRIRVAKAEPAADDAWTIIGFCAIGWLISIYFATMTFGVDAMPRLMTQFPGLM
jgi:hypothetical protein